MAKFTLELNSHSLSHYQNCAMEYKFSERDLLIPKGDAYYPFKRGEGIARYMAIWYRARALNYSADRLELLEEKLIRYMMRSEYFVNSRTTLNLRTRKKELLMLDDDKIHIASRIAAYFNKYRNENYPIIAVEKGFSKVIYEDKSVLFSYSGRPDLVLDYGKYGIGAMDHKSEAMNRGNLLHFNNQFAGYTWALGNGSGVGIVNYIGLQKDLQDGKVLRRDAFTFTEAQIDRWKSDTIEWYFRILHSIVNKKWLRSWRCEGKYGPCQYYKICSTGSRRAELIKIKQSFEKRDKAYRSW